MNIIYETKLDEEIVERIEGIHKTIPGTEESKNATDEVCKLMDRSIKLKEVKNQRFVNTKKSDDEVFMKEMEINNDRQKFKIENSVKVGTFIGGMIFTAGMGALWSAFEKDDNATFSMTKEIVKKSMSFFRLG